jgi:hypothetical protein
VPDCRRNIAPRNSEGRVLGGKPKEIFHLSFDISHLSFTAVNA